MGQPFSYKFYSTTVSAWNAMLEAILIAENSIYWELYMLVDDEAGNRFIDALCEKAKGGVIVKIIVDALGSFRLSRTAEIRLRSAGVDLVWFNRLNPGFYILDWLNRVWRRSHRKMLVIDEQVAFVGGVNVRDISAEWYDLHLKLTGKIVRPVLYGFAKDYIYAGGEKKKVARLLHPKLTGKINEIKEKARIILNSPIYAPGQSPFRRIYHKALEFAKTSFTLVTPYFAPDKHFIQLIANAKSRGVLVDIVLPWSTDIKIMRHIGEAFYGIAARAGARIHLLPRMNHAKAISVDKSMGLIGSANLTPRGLMLNQEAGIMFTEENMVRELNSIFDCWKTESSAAPSSGRKNWLQKMCELCAEKLRDFV